jgi:adenylosuccinate synthase
VARELHLKHGDEVLLAKDLKRGRDFIVHMLQNTVMFMEKELVELGESMRYPEVRAEIIRLANQYEEWPATLEKKMPSFETALFEGAQGILLDEKYGQAPHNTWTNTTFENADTLLDEVGVKDRTRIGCLRTYHTRHGAGPFPTENYTLDLPEPHNGTGEYQGSFRVGSFDFIKARQAIDITGGIDYLSLSHIDYLQRMGLKDDFADDIAGILEVPLGIKAYGPTAKDREVYLGVTV